MFTQSHKWSLTSQKQLNNVALSNCNFASRVLALGLGRCNCDHVITPTIPKGDMNIVGRQRQRTIQSQLRSSDCLVKCQL
jgi:hypothetical protein